MPSAITLRLDPASAAAIAVLWRILAESGIDTECLKLGYSPHVTLAILPEDAPVALLSRTVDTLGAAWDPLPLTLSGIGVFPGPPARLWAAPVVTRALLDRHAALHAALDHLPTDALYRPDAWVPHVTLTGALCDPGQALAVLLRMWRPLSGLLDHIELVRFPPAAVLLSHALPVTGLQEAAPCA